MIETQDIYNKLDKGDNLSKKISYLHKFKTKNKSIKMSIGRIWLNTLLPEDFPLIDEPINKNRLDKLIIEIFDKYGPEKTVTVISKIQTESFKLATIEPNSFNINSVIIPKELEEKRKDFQKKTSKMTPKEYQTESDALVKEFLDHIKKQGFSINNVFNGKVKSKINTELWKSLFISKGYIVDIEGEIYGPINKGISEGFNTEQYYKFAAEARRGFYFKSTAVQKPGYLARKVITANANIKLDNIDCRTKKYYELKVDSKKAKLLIGRYHLDKGKLVEIKDISEIKNKQIKLRSPLYCKSKIGICKYCYGKLAEKLNSKNIGMLAGGAINVVVVNKMMSMRHKSAQVELIEVDFIDNLKKSKIDLKTLKLLFNIEKTKISAKKECTIIIDKSDYDEKSLLNSSGHYFIPGIIDVDFGEGTKYESITFPFNFKVNLNKPKDLSLSGKIITLNYTSGETIISKESYTKDEDPAIVERLFEGGLKYIVNPEILLDNMYEELNSIDLVHLELIVANMFRDYNDLSKPCRLSSYENFKILGQKQIPFNSSWLNALAFENINKAIEVGLISDKDAEMNPLEKIILEESQISKSTT